MIVRISSSAVPDANLARYLQYVKRGELPLYECSPGLVAVWLLERPFVAYSELMVLSVWRNEEFMMVFVEKQPSPDGVARHPPLALDHCVACLSLFLQSSPNGLQELFSLLITWNRLGFQNGLCL